jgi:hypothetical protein
MQVAQRRSAFKRLGRRFPKDRVIARAKVPHMPETPFGSDFRDRNPFIRPLENAADAVQTESLEIFHRAEAGHRFKSACMPRMRELLQVAESKTWRARQSGHQDLLMR